MCCLLGPVVHEGLGHAVAAHAVGAPLQHVSSVDMAADEHALAPWAMRVVAAAGIVSNFVFGLLALWALRAWRSASANARYFCWLFGHSNLLVGSGYMLALSFADFGDIADLTSGLPGRTVVQLAITAAGIAVALATFIHGARSLDVFAGVEDRRRRVLVLTVLPWAVIGAVNTLAGALNPEGPLLILESAAAASFGGNFPMVWLQFALRRPRASTPALGLTPTRDNRWLAAAAVSLVLLFAVLAPGIPR